MTAKLCEVWQVAGFELVFLFTSAPMTAELREVRQVAVGFLRGRLQSYQLALALS